MHLCLLKVLVCKDSECGCFAFVFSAWYGKKCNFFVVVGDRIEEEEGMEKEKRKKNLGCTTSS